MAETHGISSFGLRKRLAWGVLPPVALLLFLNAFWSYRGAVDATNRAYDRLLNASLNSIAENIHATGGVVSVDIPYSALDVSEGGIQERVYYAIIAPDGSLLTGDKGLAIPTMKALIEEPVIIDTVFRGQPVRLATLRKRLYDPALTGGDVVTVLFAETTDARASLALSLFLDSLRPQMLLIVAGLALLILGFRSAFRPLIELRDAIDRRNEEDLTPVSPEHVPEELLPLIEAINYHMARLEKLLESRRSFLADAAHQIRTPLTLLGAQTEYGLRQSDPEEMRKTFASLTETIRSTRRMANQMLTLARAEPASGLADETAYLDFADLVYEVAGDFAVIALKKKIDLFFEPPAGPAFIEGSSTLLREMVSNLVDNALRHTPAQGKVGLSLTKVDDRVLLRVIDDGPGIPASEREKVFQRFYRILGHGDTEGSGLGLSIVREICRAHRGSIRLDDDPDGRGLLVEVTLPVRKERLV